MKHLEEILHRTIIFSTPFIVYLAFAAGVSAEFLEIALAILTILLSLYLLYRNTYKNPNKEINHFKTFWYDEFFGVKIGERLNVKADVFVIEGQTKNQHFSKELDRIFKKAFDQDEFHSPRFEWKHSNPELLKKDLKSALKDKKAVLVVRSAELDRFPWVYDLVDEWALENPESPCLYVDEPTDESDTAENSSPNLADNDKKNTDKIPDKYYSIDYKPKLVPWALLQRSNDRSYAWRSQSSFNRLMWKHTVIFIPILLSLLAIFYLEKKQEAIALEKSQKEIFQIQQDEIARATARDIKTREIKPQESVPESDKNDGQLFVSYWLIDKEHPDLIQQVGTSDPNSNRSSWTKDLNNIVGCSFINNDNFVEWYFNNGFAKVTSIHGVENTNVQCPFLNRSQDKIKSIACFAENKSGDPKLTVGVCIKTESKTLISHYDYRALLSEKALEFYNQNLKIVGLIKTPVHK